MNDEIPNARDFITPECGAALMAYEAFGWTDKRLIEELKRIGQLDNYVAYIKLVESKELIEMLEKIIYDSK